MYCCVTGIIGLSIFWTADRKKKSGKCALCTVPLNVNLGREKCLRKYGSPIDPLADKLGTIYTYSQLENRENIGVSPT